MNSILDQFRSGEPESRKLAASLLWTSVIQAKVDDTTTWRTVAELLRGLQDDDLDVRRCSACALHEYFFTKERFPADAIEFLHRGVNSRTMSLLLSVASHSPETRMDCLELCGLTRGLRAFFNINVVGLACKSSSNLKNVISGINRRRFLV